MSFKEGQVVWLLEKTSHLQRNPMIRKCVYRGKNLGDVIQYIIDGELGMTKLVGDGKLFSTLEELKSYIIGLKTNYVNNLQKEINDINLEIDEIKSLKDISEDRDKKLNTLLK
jgi:cell division ATPase FtsA